jgi:hypothetical protein
MNIYLAALVFVSLRYFFSEGDFEYGFETPVTLEDESLSSYRVYQQLSDDFSGYDIMVDEVIFDRTLTSCWVFDLQPSEYPGSETSVRIWGAGPTVPEKSGVLSVRCDDAIDELYNIVISDRKLLDVFFTEDSEIDSGTRMLHVSGFEKGDIFVAYTRDVIPYSDGEQNVLLADIPLSARQIYVEMEEDESYGPLKVTIPVAFWVEEGAFAPESVASWGEVDYSYRLECLDDTCSTVRPVFE